MKMLTRAAAAAIVLSSAPALAQEHWVEGPVWECSAYRTNPGMFDAYLKWIRSHSQVINAEAKKQGLIVDYKTFVRAPRDEKDWDVMFCTLYSSYARALDFNQGDDDKFEAISARHWATADDDKQLELTRPRLELRRFLGSSYDREVMLRPMP